MLGLARTGVRGRGLRLVFTVLLVSAALLRAGKAPADPRPPALVSIPKGASQQEALEELHRKSGLLVLSEVPQLEHVNPSAVKEASAHDAILAATAAYHLHALVGARRALFVRRFLDPKEAPDFPFEEMASIATGLDSLSGQLLLDILAPGEITPAQSAIVASLTPAQVAAAREGTLSIQDLSVAQRRQWHLINATQACADEFRTFRRMADMFRNWPAAEGRWDPDWPNPRDHLEVYYPTTVPPGYTNCGVIAFSRRGSAEIAAPSNESAEDLPLPPRPITGCSNPYEVDTPSVTAGEIVSRIAATNHVTIRVPEWAESRRYLLFAAGHTGDEVLQALADINGWVIRSLGKGRFSLSRPAPSPASDFLEYYRKARAVLPPVLRQMILEECIRRKGRDAARLEQLSARRRRLAAEPLANHLAKVRKDDHPFPVRELEPDWQRLVANLAFDNNWLDVTAATLVNPPHPWLIYEDQGSFWLKSGLGLPLFTFGVPKGAAGNSNEDPGWGWALNSATPAEH